MHYIVLGGGTSPERDVSLRSSKAVENALIELGHSVSTLDPRDVTNDEIIRLSTGSHGIFPILHGEGGEDGTLQAMLEAAGLPFFGPSSEAAFHTFDKVIFKKLLEASGIPTPRWHVVTASTFDDEPLAQSPFVLKPIRGGSSIDTFIVRHLPFDSAPMREALERYGEMLIEELIEGTETTIGVLEQTALPVIEIIPPQDHEFDYENKYNGTTQELCPPASIDESTQHNLQVLAEKVHAITQCRHLSRTDVLINKNGDFFVIDTNTIPGLTNQSLFPKAARVAGLEWTDLVARFTELLK